MYVYIYIYPLDTGFAHATFVHMISNDSSWNKQRARCHNRAQADNEHGQLS